MATPQQPLCCKNHFPPRTTIQERETAFLLYWDGDIKRAALSAANRGAGDKEDLEQDARIHLLLLYRCKPDAPPAYIRTVIANALRSVHHREGRSLTSRSPLATRLDLHHRSLLEEPECGEFWPISVWASQLPTRLRAVYFHLYTEEHSQRDTARVMRISQPRVAQLHHQLLDRARRELARQTFH
jgi:DNA-directed RNA polymerase specialized sigma24 family protein